MEEDFSFPMESLAPFVDRVEEAEVKVDLEFHDFYTWMRGEGHSRWVEMYLNENLRGSRYNKVGEEKKFEQLES